MWLARWLKQILVPHDNGDRMQYEAFEDKLYAPDWRVEASDPEGEGDVYVTLFSGPQAKERAEEYAAWKNACAVRTVAAPA